MKSILNPVRFIPVIGIVLLTLLNTACEQQNYEPNANAAPGGGTVSTYKAYTLTAADGKGINGRVVFYKYSSLVTLVQMGLYNTVSGTSYSAAIYPGVVTVPSVTPLKTLDAVDGATGAFATNKYYTINEAGFFDKLSAYNASVKIMAGSTPVATGNIGANAAPVAQAQ